MNGPLPTEGYWTAPIHTPLPARRTGDLLSTAAARTEGRQRREAERAAAERCGAEARLRRPDGLPTRIDAAWLELEDLIEVKRAAEYEQAVSLLFDLKALAEHDGWDVDFRQRIVQLRARLSRKGPLILRLDRTSLRGQADGYGLSTSPRNCP